MLRRIPLVVTLAAAQPACTRHYKAPDVPANELAFVTADDRADVLSVDGLPPYVQPGATEFAIGTGCRELVVEYAAAYTNTHGALRDDPSLAEFASRLEVHSYRTDKPIHFFIPAKPGLTYWVTSSFNGTQFFPRVSALNPSSGEAEATFTPDVKCDAR